MGSKAASSLSGIVEIGLAHEGENEIIEGSHDFAHSARGHASGIFLQCEIAAVMETGFDAPVRSANLQQVRRCSLCAGQAGNAEFHFTGSAIRASVTPPLKLAFQAIDLRQPRRNTH